MFFAKNYDLKVMIRDLRDHFYKQNFDIDY